MSYLHTVFILVAFVLSCSSEDTEPTTMPSDLTLDITLVGADDAHPNGNGSGTVQVSASAKNAVRYAFRFENGDLQENASGSIEHKFPKEGTHSYTLAVWAYSQSGEFITKTERIEVFKSDADFATLVFSDEFGYEGSPDTKKWHHQVIPPDNGSWHNNELQHYTDRTDNSFVSDGTLKIVALEEQYTAEGSTKSYTSARLNSKFAFTYGRVEVRAKLPGKAGTWPAIWTLGANSGETGNYFGDQYGSVGWPGCGEIDIMEQNGWDKNSIITHFHWGDTNTGEYKNTGTTTPIATASNSFHLYAMEWDSESIKVFVDKEQVVELPNTSDKPYSDPQYLLLNVAMGGSLGGDIPENFSEDTFEIDYVRIYQ
ncbi:MAG TPA: glycoside hydrolase family 16 protein [Pricia sp.]|nr:glycoside hydrolase family 16 protein [Pricia sp.]